MAVINDTVADMFAENHADASSLAALASFYDRQPKSWRWRKDARRNFGKMTTVSVSGVKRQTAAAAAATENDRCGIKTPVCAGRAPYNETRLASHPRTCFATSACLLSVER